MTETSTILRVIVLF